MGRSSHGFSGLGGRPESWTTCRTLSGTPETDTQLLKRPDHKGEHQWAEHTQHHEPPAAVTASAEAAAAHRRCAHCEYRAPPAPRPLGMDPTDQSTVLYRVLGAMGSSRSLFPQHIIVCSVGESCSSKANTSWALCEAQSLTLAHPFPQLNSLLSRRQFCSRPNNDAWC